MSAALSLLISAQLLLSLVTANPHLPTSFVDSARATALYAIDVANAELAALPVSTPTPPPQTATLIPLGIINKPMAEQDLSSISIEVLSAAPADKQNGLPFGEYMLAAMVKDASGKPIKDAEITMSYRGDSTVQRANRQTVPHAADWSAPFQFIPKSAGPKKLTFSSGSLSTEHTIDVQ